MELLTKFKNTTGMSIITDGGKIEFNKDGRTDNLELGKFYRVINNYFKQLNKLKRFTNVYIIDDKDNLLGEPDDKNSPADMGKSTWELLYEKKKRIL